MSEQPRKHEIMVARYIQSVYSTIYALFAPQMKFDRVIKPGGSNKRPDIQFRIEGYAAIFIIETDENQHKAPAYANETSRLLELYADCDGQSLYVIRINPDKYITKDGGEMASFDERCAELVNCINGTLIMPPEKGLHVCKLFYDYYDPISYEWQKYA